MEYKSKKIYNQKSKTLDALVKDYPLFQESEVVVFEGRVRFKSELRNDDKKILRTGQWGGVGGRFGGQIGQVIDLSKNILEHFKSSLSIDTDIKGAKKDPDLHGQSIPQE